jgi:hypothetical protein
MCARTREREEKDMYLRHGYGTRNGVSEIAFVGWIRIFGGAFMRIYSQTIRSQSGQETSSRGSTIWELCTIIRKRIRGIFFVHEGKLKITLYLCIGPSKYS